MKEIFILIRNVSALILSMLFLLFLERNLLAGEFPILINEIVFDPVGTDLGYEWIELYNSNDTAINLNDYKVQIAGSAFIDSVTLTGIIDSHSYYTICENSVFGCSQTVEKIGMQNGGGATDGVRLLDSSGKVVDIILYDLPNTNLLRNEIDVVVPNEQTAIIGDSGESLGRINFVDTNNSQADFYIFTQTSLGKENVGINDDDTIPQTGSSPLFIIPSFIILLFSGMLLTYLKFACFNQCQKQQRRLLQRVERHQRNQSLKRFLHHQFPAR